MEKFECLNCGAKLRFGNQSSYNKLRESKACSKECYNKLYCSE